MKSNKFSNVGTKWIILNISLILGLQSVSVYSMDLIDLFNTLGRACGCIEETPEQEFLRLYPTWMAYVEAHQIDTLSEHVGQVESDYLRTRREAVRVLEGQRQLTTQAPVTVNRMAVIEPHVFASGQDTTCSVCMSEMEPGQQIAKLPCRHCFHRSPCLTRWVQARNEREEHPNCPNCRQEWRAGESTLHTVRGVSHREVLGREAALVAPAGFQEASRQCTSRAHSAAEE